MLLGSLGQIALKVSDADRAEQFYSKAWGCPSCSASLPWCSSIAPASA